MNSKSSAGCSVSNARTARLRRSRAIARSVWTAKRPVSSTSSSTCSPSAAASTSKPGPRFADEAGTRTRPALGSCTRSRARRRRCPARTGTTEPAWASAVCGSLSPWPVSTQAIRSAPSAPFASSPATPGGRGRLAEHALLAGQEPVGVEDLLVGDRAHLPARAREGVERLLPAGGVADPDRARDRLGRLDRRAVHERRGALGLEAEHPRARAALRKPFQYAVTLPALPTGMHSASISPSSSSISKAAVFCPSSRNGLTELTSAIGRRCASSRTSVSAWSKLPRSAITRAPCISACASLPVAILPSGTITTPFSPPRAA